MSQSIFPFFAGSSRDSRPLPLIVAEKWGFPLAYHDTDESIFYNVQDWIRGISTTDEVRQVWDKMKASIQLSNSIRQLPYVAANGKSYQLDFVVDKGLYLIAQHMRAIKSRPVLAEIKKFLAESGAFTDLVRREPKTMIESGAINLDDALDAVIEGYRKAGKTDSWINARMSGRVKRVMFTTALRASVAEYLTPKHYAIATDDIYIGLWGRTTQYLLGELELPKNTNLRDHQPTLALTYQGIAEEVSALKLGDRVDLSFNDARIVIKHIAKLIGDQAQITSLYLKMDLATGFPLLAEPQ